MSDPKFINGLIVKAPHERAPEYVKAKLSMKRVELIQWLQQQDGEWINADIKVSQNGKWYAAVDDWKPNQGNGTPRRSEPLPSGGTGPVEHASDVFDDDFDPIPF